MTARIKSIRLLPVSKANEIDYLLSEVTKKIGDARKLVDDYGSKYDHETPWSNKYLQDPKFFLYRVTIGVVGRINSCDMAARLGLLADIPAKSHHFTSMALYYVFRIARQTRREYRYLMLMEKWLNGFIKDVNKDSRFLEYRKAYGKREKEEDY